MLSACNLNPAGTSMSAMLLVILVFKLNWDVTGQRHEIGLKNANTTKSRGRTNQLERDCPYRAYVKFENIPSPRVGHHMQTFQDKTPISLPSPAGSLHRLRGRNEEGSS